MTENDNVKGLCDAVMHAVVRTGVMQGHDDVDRCAEIMRDEIKRLIVPARDTEDFYADAREAVMRRSVHDGYVTALVAVRCVERITAARAA